MTGSIAAFCQGEGCARKKPENRGKPQCIRGLDNAEVCPNCLIAGPDFDKNGVLK